MERKNLDYNEWGPLVEAVSFAKEGKELLSHAKRLVELDPPAVEIPPRFDRLIIDLRVAVAYDFILDKSIHKHDVLDSFRLSLKGYQVLR